MATRHGGNTAYHEVKKLSISLVKWKKMARQKLSPPKKKDSIWRPPECSRVMLNHRPPTHFPCNVFDTDGVEGADH